jgi:hypothetical protein
MADRGEPSQEGSVVDGDSDDAGVPVTPALLADLQAGLLDDDTAARVRRQAREDPEARRMVAALDRVRRDLADLGTDADSAPAVPDDVAARMATALQATSSDGPAHAARRKLDRVRLIVAGIGAAAALVAVGLGTLALVGTSKPIPSSGPTVESLTVAPSSNPIPLSDPEILAVLTEKPDLGALADPQRRSSCLRGLGYSSAAAVVGARQLAVNGRPGVLLLLSGASPRTVTALVVAPNCSSVDTGLLAETMVTRP